MLGTHAKRILSGRYTHGTETPEAIFERVANYYGSNAEHSKRLLRYFENLWAIPASPILANGGTEPLRGLPISCFLQYVQDDRQGLCDHFEEIMWLGTSGGGLGSHWSSVRSPGQKTSRGTVASGAVQFMHIADSMSLACAQGSVRQASYAAYLDVSHPEIFEFVAMRNPSGGDIHRKNLNVNSAVNIPDSFMEAVLADEEHHLIDPHSGQMVQTVRARELWQLILETRLQTGEPYICFIDQCNRFLHPDLKEKGLKVNGSNLCVEITLPTSPDRTAVCCLSSVNLEYYDEWKDTTLVQDMIEFLDNVLTDFIKKAPPPLKRAVFSALSERSIGLGAMGFHSYLQRHMVPIESPSAIGINLEIFSYIKEQAQIANVRLAKERGPAPDLKNDRFAHLLAIAPNASTAIIAGSSPSIEPWNNNYFLQPTASGALPMKNKYLDKLFEEKAYAYREEGAGPRERAMQIDFWWSSVLENGGSVQHLSCLDSWEKDVFKTAMEIDQRALVKLAADRQKFICQSQSLNLFFPAGVDISYFNKVHIDAWRSGVKTLYYVRSEPARKASLVSVDLNSCLNCEG